MEEKGEKEVNPPSRLLHCRNVTEHITHADILNIGAPFGPVDDVIVLREKKQAFLQMETVAHAAAVLNFYHTGCTEVRGRRIYMNYSRHAQLSGGAPVSAPPLACAIPRAPAPALANDGGMFWCLLLLGCMEPSHYRPFNVRFAKSHPLAGPSFYLTSSPPLPNSAYRWRCSRSHGRM